MAGSARMTASSCANRRPHDPAVRGQRRRQGANPLGVGVIAAGSIYYLQDRAFFDSSLGGQAVCRDPWIVEGFLNGTLGAGRRNRDTGLWENVTISGRSDTAVVRSLRNGRRKNVGVHLLQLHDDKSLTKQLTDDPTLRDLALYRLRPVRPRCAE